MSIAGVEGQQPLTHCWWATCAGYLMCTLYNYLILSTEAYTTFITPQLICLEVYVLSFLSAFFLSSFLVLPHSLSLSLSLQAWHGIRQNLLGQDAGCWHEDDVLFGGKISAHRGCNNVLSIAAPYLLLMKPWLISFLTYSITPLVCVCGYFCSPCGVLVWVSTWASAHKSTALIWSKGNW